MKKFYLFFISIIFCFLMISCSNLYQDLTSTTVELTPEFISHVRNTTTGDNNYIFAKLTCGRKTITKKIDISEQTAANGAVLTFDNLIVGKKGSVYIAVANDETVEDFKSETIASIEGTTNFTVQPNNQTKIKVTLNPATKYTAYFTTFTETLNGTTPSYPVITFTQNSTITAPLPVGTTRWSIRETSTPDYPGQLIGSFGEKIDVKNELMKYREKFFEISGEEYDENLIQVYFDATGNPMNQIKTPIVYCETTTTNEAGPTYTYKILGSNTPVLPTTSEIKDSCFDNAGNFYFVTSDGVFKIAYNHKENKYEDFEENSIEITDVQLSSYDNAQISYDKAQNYLYVYGSQINPAASASTYIHRIQNPAGAIYKNTIVVPESFWTEDPFETNNDAYTSYNFTVHNGILYVSKIQRTEQGDSGTKYSYSLVLQKGSIETGTFDDTTVEYEILSNAQNGLSGTTDIMFQDGSLYIIFSCYNGNWAGSDDEAINYNYSTGGIVKYTESEQFDGDFGIKGFVDRSNTIKNIGTSESDVNYYAPTSGNNGTESKYFYGPKQFVAIMPKKLVFLDSGADVSSYANYDDDYIPSKSRIVEYDLSTNSFSSKEITGTDLGFNFSGHNISFF